jgi:hypothetical protein
MSKISDVIVIGAGARDSQRLVTWDAPACLSRFSKRVTGAYSYGAVGSDCAQQTLATPVENTLFFAGEATDTTGHNGIVHGAIASGRRAAREILLGFHSKSLTNLGEAVFDHPGGIQDKCPSNFSPLSGPAVLIP